ncbi:MAG: ATP-binding cassette domain-containing protein, partial [Gaiellaceae bacterium]
MTAGYGRSPVINDITLTADLGSVTTIIGPNGAGKSTFAKTLVGVLKPMSGRIMVNGFDITT